MTNRATKIKQMSLLLLTSLCMSSTNQVNDLDEGSLFTESILGKNIEGVVKRLDSGSQDFTTKSNKDEWMTKTKLSWECLKMGAAYTHQDVIYSRVINCKMAITINPEKIKHKVDWLGFNVPSDCPRLKSFWLDFTLDNSLSNRAQVLFSSVDQFCTNQSGSTEKAFYRGLTLSKIQGNIRPDGYPKYLPLFFYGKKKEENKKITDTDKEAIKLPNEIFSMSSSNNLLKDQKNLTCRWTFNSGDGNQSDVTSESNRMYAAEIERKMHPNVKNERKDSDDYYVLAEKHEDIKYYHESLATITFYYTFAFSDTSYPEKIKMRFGETAEVGYEVMGSALDQEYVASDNIGIALN